MIALDIPAQAPEKEKKSERKKGRKNKVKKEEREGAESKEGGKEKVKEMLEELFNLKQRNGGGESVLEMAHLGLSNQQPHHWDQTYLSPCLDFFLLYEFWRSKPRSL